MAITAGNRRHSCYWYHTSTITNRHDTTLRVVPPPRSFTIPYLVLHYISQIHISMSESSDEYVTDSDLSSTAGGGDKEKAKADKKKSKKKEKKTKKAKSKEEESFEKKDVRRSKSDDLSDLMKDSKREVRRTKSGDGLKKTKSSRDLKKSKSKKKLSVVLDPDLEDGLTDLFPKNSDGTLWKQPLKFWTNKPKKLNEPGAKVILWPDHGTDLFCRTKDAQADNPHFYWHKVTGDFNCLVKIKGNFASDYDKAGILLRQDDRHWVLSGLEYYDGRLCLSTSITRNITDWSLSFLADEAKVKEEGIWVAVKRQEDRVACFYSYDLEQWSQTRMGEFEVEDTIKVGLLCACPEGEPFKVVFERFSIQSMAKLKQMARA